MSDNPPSTIASSDHPTAAPHGFELLDEIGRGGMGIIYRARDLALGREVAVKVIDERFVDGSVARRRFVDEARITGQLQHPVIPAVYQVGALPDGRPFLAMKLIRGRTLERLLKERPDPSTDRGRFLAIFEQACQAVGYAHAHHVVHRDLKPANIMVGAFGEVQVMDWGLAKVLTGRGAYPAGPDEDPDATLLLGTEIQTTRGEDAATQAGSLLGTPAFMPPEQAIGAIDQIDARSDVFGLGAVLCTILTGKPPYVGADKEATRQMAARAGLDDALARLDTCGAEPGLVDLCKRCLSAEKGGRPDDAGVVARVVADLRAAADDRARRAEVDQVRAETEAREQRKRRKVQLALFGVLGLLLAGGGAFAWWQDRTRARQVERLRRNGEGVAALLARCEEALKEDDAQRAGLVLEQAEKRAAEGGAEHLAARFGRDRSALDLLTELDQIDTFRWTVVAGKVPDRKSVVNRWRAALARYGLEPAKVPANAAAGRVAESIVRNRLLATLDLWLVWEPSPWTRAILKRIDPDEYRDAVRDAVAAGDGGKVATLAGAPAARGQPPRFAAALGQYGAAVPPGFRRNVLESALRGRPGDLSLLMALGGSFPISTSEGADERLRWYQAAVAAQPRSVPARNSLSLALSDKGDAEAALAELIEARRLDPGYAAVQNNLGVRFRRTKDFDAGLIALNEAIRLNPKDAALPLVNLGLIRRDKGDLDGAIAEFKKAIELDPRSTFAHSYLIAALRDKIGPDAVLAQCLDAARSKPNDPMTRVNLGNVLRERKDWSQAAAAYKAAIDLDPKSAMIRLSLAELLHERKDFDGAIEAYKVAIRLAPDSVAIPNRMMECFRSKGDPNGGVEAARETARLHPTSPIAHHALGDALHFLKRDLVAAAVAYREAIRLNPTYAWSHNNLATALRYSGDLEGAIGEYREAVRLAPDFTSAWFALGEALGAKKDWDAAIAAYRAAFDLDPKRLDARVAMAHALRQKGALLDAKKELDSAIATYRAMIDRDPKNFGARIALAQALKAKAAAQGAKKDWDEAIAAFGAAIDLDPKNVDARLGLANALKEMGAQDQAIATYQAAVRLNPENATAQADLGHALFDRKDWDGAIAAYKASLRHNSNDSWFIRKLRAQPEISST